MVADVARLEDRIDRVAAGAVQVSDALGGVRFQNMLEVMEFAKLMACAGNAVPKHLQANPGGCLAVTIQALEWGFSPFAVASQHYDVGGRAGYMAQLVHAVIEKRAPLMGRLRHRYEGEGDERVCIITGHVRGEADPIEHRSPPFGKITPKNSPLWKTKPDLQLYYNTVRDFCRVYFPDVLLGVYTEDELRESHVGPDRAKDITPDKPSVGERLKAKKGARGFSQEHVDREADTATQKPADAAEAQPAPEQPEAPVANPEPNLPEQTAPQPETPEQTAAEQPADEEQARAEPVDAPQRLRAAFADALYGADSAAALKKKTAEFWNTHEYPDDDAQKSLLDKIHSLHVRRIKGEVEPADLREMLVQWIAG